MDENASEKHAKMSKYVFVPAGTGIPSGTLLEKSFLNVLFQGQDFRLGMDQDCLMRLRYFPIEFSVNYVSHKTRKNISPSSMLTYMRGINRRFDKLGFPVNINDGPIFNDSENGPKNVLENRFAEQQAEGNTGASHNVLTIQDV